MDHISCLRNAILLVGDEDPPTTRLFQVICLHKIFHKNYLCDQLGGGGAARRHLASQCDDKRPR